MDLVALAGNDINDTVATSMWRTKIRGMHSAECPLIFFMYFKKLINYGMSCHMFHPLENSMKTDPPPTFRVILLDRTDRK